MCLRLQWFRYYSYYLKRKGKMDCSFDSFKALKKSKGIPFSYERSQFLTKDITAMNGCGEVSVVAGKNLKLFYRANLPPSKKHRRIRLVSIKANA